MDAQDAATAAGDLGKYDLSFDASNQKLIAGTCPKRRFTFLRPAISRWTRPPTKSPISCGDS